VLIAVTRPVSPSLARCELTHLAREPIDVPRATRQHAAYERLLESLGATIVRVPAAPELPDAVFVEDIGVVLDEVAVITRPGASSRRAESTAVATALAVHRPLVTMTAPAMLDGGDVLRLGRTLYTGRSSRTNDEGLRQLRGATATYGYRVVEIPFTGCLHLKSAVTAVTDELLLLNPVWVAPAEFPDWDTMEVDGREPHAANALRVAAAIVYPSQHPRTLERLVGRGLRVVASDCDELAKAEGAVTCCSLLFETASSGG
jgi:dimethylargininase